VHSAHRNLSFGKLLKAVYFTRFRSFLRGDLVQSFFVKEG
jgi:hypothetical protein